MPDSTTSVIRRFVELFNRDLADVKGGISTEMRELFTPETVLVPMRAALEGTEYKGESALDAFSAAMTETWTRLQIESDELREIEGERALLVGDLVGTGRESGAQTRQRCAWTFVLRDGQIAETRTFLTEREALEALGP